MALFNRRMFNNGCRSPSPAMSDYLDRIGAGLVIADAEPFNFDFLPPELVMREEEMAQFATMMGAVVSHSGSSTAIVTGSVGTGKSAMVKRFCEDVVRRFSERRKIRYVIVNCRNSSTNPEVLKSIVQFLDPRHPFRGLGGGEILSSVRKILRSSSEHLIIVLDEVDHLLRRSGDDILYNLLRIDEGHNEHGTLSLILISQEATLDFLETAVISRFGHSNQLRLERYDEEGLMAIARQRAGLGLVDGSYDDGILRLVAQAAAEIADARVVIELLEGAAMRAELAGRSDIEPKDVQSVANLQPTHLDGIEIDDLPPHCMMVLLAVCRRLKTVNEIATGDVGSIYKVVCEEFEVKAKGHTTLWKHLKRLEDRSILIARSSTISHGRGRTQFFSMPAALPTNIEKRLETLIPARLRR